MQDLMDLKEVIVSSGAAQDEMVESKPAKHLTKRVDRLIGQIDSVMDELQAEKKRFQVVGIGLVDTFSFQFEVHYIRFVRF